MDRDELLEAVRNYLDITFEDKETDEKLKGIMERGMAYMDRVAGTSLDYGKEDMPRQLLLDYCRYARNNVAELFGKNFEADLVTLRNGVQADDYARQQGYI